MSLFEGKMSRRHRCPSRRGADTGLVPSDPTSGPIAVFVTLLGSLIHWPNKRMA